MQKTAIHPSTNTSSPSTETSNVLSGSAAGGKTTAPVLTLNCEPWQVHSTTSSWITLLISSSQCAWVQILLVAKIWPSILYKATGSLLPMTTFLMPPSGTSFTFATLTLALKFHLPFIKATV